MKNLFRKASAVAMSAALALNGTAVGSAVRFTADAADAAKFEFEDAKITGDVTVEKDASASGGSVLKMTESGTIELTSDGKDKVTCYLDLPCQKLHKPTKPKENPPHEHNAD